MTNLLINVDHIATLRNARRETFPDPVYAAALCETAGADGIVFHLREDRRHINERDVRILKEVVKGKLDFELSTNAEIVSVCCDVQPTLATLVPERREEVTTEGGLDVIANRTRLERVVTQLLEAGVHEVAIFVDPVMEQISAAADVGANCIELHTGDFSNATSPENRERLASVLAEAAELGHELGLAVHAGHGLDYLNYHLFKQTVPYVEEVSIGFAVIARAVLVGIEQAVRDMRLIVKGY
jgi:pyridoxine 5-phosphate synthase